MAQKHICWKNCADANLLTELKSFFFYVTTVSRKLLKMGADTVFKIQKMSAERMGYQL
jgi:hypothetical protein